MDYKNLKNLEITPATGKNPWDTDVVSAKPGKSFMGDNNNSTEQYTAPNPRIGGKGGNSPSGKDGS